jgi:serine phosphatase RsbU (regulator of sigma subunit)
LSVFSQSRKSDSLYSIYKNTSLADTTRLRALQDLGWSFGKRNPDSAITLTKILLKETRDKKLIRYEAAALSNLGVFYKNKNEYSIAKDYMEKALDIRMKRNDRKGIAASYNGLGNLYSRMLDFPKAIDYFLKNIQIYESLNEPEQQAMAQGNIGNIYFRLKDYRQAVNYHLKSLLIKKMSGLDQSASTNYINISSAYYGLSKFDSAMYYVKKAITINKKENNERDLGLCYQNMGDIYYSLRQYDSALFYFEKTLAYSKKSKDIDNEARTLISLGDLYYVLDKPVLAKQKVEEALVIFKKIEDKIMIQGCYEFLYQLYKKQNNHKEALKYHELYIGTRDSMRTEENEKAVLQRSFQYEFEKKSLADSLLLTEEKKLGQAKLEQEKTKQWALYGGLGLFALFAGFMFNRYRVTQKQKKIIEAKEKETHRQKEIIEEKQTEILDSMIYAKRIQGSLMAGKKIMDEHLNDYFIYFRPKDIVSGDFYWSTIVQNSLKIDQSDTTVTLNNFKSPLNNDKLFYLAVCDSTGHGVPGAMMSMLNISCLNEAVNERKLTNPAEILNYARTKIISSLAGDGSDDGGKDGMDGVVCCFDKEKKTLTYSAANNSFYIIRKGNLLVFKADKMPVGKSPKESQSFTSHTIELETGDMIYIFTDGYADQFGGPGGKKFKYKQMEELLVKHHTLPLAEQKNKIEEVFNNWKGNLEQVDDICVIGIQI